MAGFNFEAMSRAVLAACRKRNLTLATAESCTGGLLASTLVEIPGSSHVLERGFITYSNEAKTELLGVPAEMIEEHGAVSEPVARAMAEGALERAPVDIAIAITGVAGPGGTETKPEGLVHFGFARKGHETVHVRIQFGAVGRNRVRSRSVRQALEMLLASTRGRHSAGQEVPEMQELRPDGKG